MEYCVNMELWYNLILPRYGSNSHSIEGLLGLWKNEFVGLEQRYWSSPPTLFNVQRLNGYSETFSFYHNTNLFVGLNIPSSDSRNNQNQNEWDQRLRDQLYWTIDLIRDYYRRSTSNIIVVKEDDDDDKKNNNNNNDDDNQNTQQQQQHHEFTGRVILFGHANPDGNVHDAFFGGLVDFLYDEVQMNHTLPLIRPRYNYTPAEFQSHTLCRVFTALGPN